MSDYLTIAVEYHHTHGPLDQPRFTASGRMFQYSQADIDIDPDYAISRANSQFGSGWDMIELITCFDPQSVCPHLTHGSTPIGLRLINPARKAAE